MAAYKPKNVDEYLDLLDQAIYEADEIIACAADEDAIDSMELTELLPVYEALSRELRKLDAEIKSGTQ